MAVNGIRDVTTANSTRNKNQASFVDIQISFDDAKTGDASKEQTSMTNINQIAVKQAIRYSTEQSSSAMIKKNKIANPNAWKRNIAKTKRNSGEEYVSRSGKQVSAKIFNDIDCLCKMRCISLISTEEREAIFKRYWNFSSESKLVFICGHVQQIDICHRSRKKENSKRKKSCNYFLPKFDNSMVRVCKVYFRDTLQISNGALGRALKRANDMDFTDRRGKKEPGNKKSKEEIQKIIDHINSFPTTRSSSSHKSKTSYLPDHLNLKTLYRLYQQSCVYTKPVSETLYKKVFYTHFNLKFKKPVKDICSKCERSATGAGPSVKDDEQKAFVGVASRHLESMPQQLGTSQHQPMLTQPQPLPPPQTLQQPQHQLLPPQQLDYSHNPLTNDAFPINYYRSNMWMQADQI